MDKDTKVEKKQFDNENTEEALVKKTPVEGVNMEEDKKQTGDDDTEEED
jgi:hypothetical protein